MAAASIDALGHRMFFRTSAPRPAAEPEGIELRVLAEGSHADVPGSVVLPPHDQPGPELNKMAAREYRP